MRDSAQLQPAIAVAVRAKRDATGPMYAVFLQRQRLKPPYQVERLIIKLRRLFPGQVVNEAFEKVEQRVRLNPMLFKRALSKAKAYTKRASSEEAFVLWIACHLYDLMVEFPWCFYCAKPFNETDFLGPEVHLEHFIPRSRSPMPDLFGRLPYDAHHPHRIVLACPACNNIKSNHSSRTFAEILRDPEAFFRTRRYKHDRKEHLKDFAELYCLSTMGEEYAERHKITLADVKERLETLRERYRKRWGT